MMTVSTTFLTPNEFKNYLKTTKTYYGFHPTPFGDVLILATSQEVYGLFFTGHQDPQNCFFEAARFYGQEKLIHAPSLTQTFYDAIFENKPVLLLLGGTSFQIKVWQALLLIPKGKTTTYENVAQLIGHPKACRAVGHAIGQNPISYLIPCHRVIRKSGDLGGYRWGIEQKKRILDFEMS